MCQFHPRWRRFHLGFVHTLNTEPIFEWEVAILFIHLWMNKMVFVSPVLSTLQIRGVQLRFVTEIPVLVCEQKSCYPVFVPAQKLYGIKWTKPWFKRRNSQRTECFRAITRGAYSITEGPIVDVLQLYQSYIWTLIQMRRKGMACHRDASVHRLQRFAIFLSLRFQRCIRCGNDFLVLKNRKESPWCCFSWVVSFFWCAVPKKICQ